VRRPERPNGHDGGIGPKSGDQKRPEEVVDSHSLELERQPIVSAYLLILSPTMEKETEIRRIPAPSLQAFLTRASATLNKVSASRRLPSEASSEDLTLEADLNKLRGNAKRPPIIQRAKVHGNIQHSTQIADQRYRQPSFPHHLPTLALGASHLRTQLEDCFRTPPNTSAPLHSRK
jgi:hypothetical protein